ncbi:hypothetical protein BASA83_013694 [Batrachochytrium salamandrivorans]|nr:hypothetical protein BASA83_013694 [Batrachochytrium salamandrivorans]
MANSDISVPSVDHRQEHHQQLPHSRYTALQPSQSLTSAYSRSNPGPPDGACIQDRPPYYKTRCSIRITVPEDRQRNIIQRLERQSKQTHWRIRQNYRHRRPDQPRPTAPPPPLSRRSSQSMLPISATNACYPPFVRNTRLWAISETCIPPLNSAYCTWIRCHPASSHWTWTQRNRPRYPIVLWWP